MLITYTIDNNNWVWACVYLSDGTYSHWFLGSKDIDTRKKSMYEVISRRPLSRGISTPKTGKPYEVNNGSLETDYIDLCALGIASASATGNMP